MRNEKGFTLVELLAVVAILAVLALITIPIISGVITDSSESTNKASATNYIRAIDTEIKTGNLDYISVENGFYKISKDGNVCLEELENGKCKGKKIKISAKGNLPIRGNVTIENEEVTRGTIIYDDYTVELSYEGEMEYFPVAKKYEIGQEVIFNPGDQDRTWNVIKEDTETVTLMLNQNLGRNIEWVVNTSSNENGPYTALSYLFVQTKAWTNVDPIDNFIYINNLNGTAKPYGYQKLQINKGNITLIYKDGNSWNPDGVSANARILSYEEVIELVQILNPNLKEENLIAYLERNLDAINVFLIDQGNNAVGTVDELIELFINANPECINEPKIWNLCLLVYEFTSFGIEPEYNIKFDDFLFQNLGSSGTLGYWLLTSSQKSKTNAFDMENSEYYVFSEYTTVTFNGVRPVITIPKTKLD